MEGHDGKHFKTFYAEEYLPRVCELLATALLQPLLETTNHANTTVNDVSSEHIEVFEQFNVPVTVDTQIGPDLSRASLVSSLPPS